MPGYFGNKGVLGLYQAIINIIPPHDIYIEPFLGSGQIMKKKAPCIHSFGVDLERYLIDKSDYRDHQSIELICGDGIKFIREYPFTGKEVVYCDPPYPHSTRSKKRYKHDLTDHEHIAICELIKGIEARVIISTYPNEIYDKHLAEWNHFELQVSTHGGIRTEQVWYNYDLAEAHFHTFAGKNFTDRQRIKRKAERWAKKYSKLPPQERQAILAALLHSH